MKTLGRISAVVMLFLFAFPAAAVPIFFNDRGAFNAAAGGALNFEGFEGNFAVAGTIAFPGFTVSETNGVNALGQLRDFPGLVNGITEGTGALVYDDNGNSIGTFFSFAGGSVQAFGVDITANPGGTVTIGGSVSDVLVLATNTPSFWGVIETAGITSISFDVSGGPNVAFDAAAFGNVPEPATLALLGLGLAGLALTRRRKKA